MTEFGTATSASQTSSQQILVNSTAAGQQTFLISGPNGKVQMIPVSSASPAQPQQTVLIANGALGNSSTDLANTVVYQPVTVDQTAGHTAATSVFPASLIQQLLQQTSQQNQTSTISVPTQNGNVIMLVQNNGTATPIQLSQPLTTQNQIQIQNGVVSTPGTTNNSIASAQALPAAEVEEEPLYVNAKQYHRILKRRQARARLEAQGKIPKERRRYLHESRHRHAMNRVRGEGGRFHARDEKESEANGTEETADGQQCLNEYFSQIPNP